MSEIGDAKRSPDAPQQYLQPTGRIDEIVKLGTALQALATEHRIHNVFDDNGYKELLLLTLFNLRKLAREGDDAVDESGRQFEIKTVARMSSAGKRKTSLNVTTEHTMTLANIERYRNTFLWIVAIFNQEKPEAIYEISPRALEPYFQKWEVRLRQMGGDPRLVHINNPKIPVKFIEANGIRVWPAEAGIAVPRHVQDALLDLERSDLGE